MDPYDDYHKQMRKDAMKSPRAKTVPRIVKDDSGERDGYWIGDKVARDFVMAHVYDAIVADTKLRERRRAARIVEKILERRFRSWTPSTVAVKEFTNEILAL